MTQSYIQRHSLDIILLVDHQGHIENLPTWCPSYFWLDETTPDDRIWDLTSRHRAHETQQTPNSKVAVWTATGTTRASCTFHGTTLVSSAHRIGSISSLGSSWTDTHDAPYPKHDEAWATTTKNSSIRDTFWEAMLRKDYVYNTPRGPQPDFGLDKHLRLSRRTLEAYRYVHAFLPSHGSYDPEVPGAELPRWLCANRRFFAGGRALEDHAKRLWPTIFHCGLATWLYEDERVFKGMIDMAKRDMRLMCLDAQAFGIGWAAKGADLGDEVFLLPGCSVPVILRKAGQEGRYSFFGDAIVIGAMENEVWGRLKPSDLCEVEII
jgi:hypothetical protein